jgi:hypothetical protein
MMMPTRPRPQQQRYECKPSLSPAAGVAERSVVRRSETHVQHPCACCAVLLASHPVPTACTAAARSGRHAAAAGGARQPVGAASLSLRLCAAPPDHLCGHRAGLLLLLPHPQLPHLHSARHGETGAGVPCRWPVFCALAAFSRPPCCLAWSPAVVAPGECCLPDPPRLRRRWLTPLCPSA